MAPMPHLPAVPTSDRAPAPILLLDDEPAAIVRAAGTGAPADPAELMLTCANCGAPMDERKCKLVCRCGYFLSCSDYL